jgi:dihydropyrimidinase
MKDLLIKNGTVVTEDAVGICDVRCSGGKIVEVAPHIETGDADTIDAVGKIVIPGGVDVHTHLNLDVGIAVASDDFYTGTVAAAFGGTTSIVDHLAFGPKGCPLDTQIKKYHGFADGQAVIDYGFHGVIQHVDADVLAKMESLIDEGISSYKIYLTYDYKVSDSDAYQVLQRAKELGLIITVHPENHELTQFLRAKFVAEGKTSPYWHPRSRPVECEAEAINRMILLAQAAGTAAPGPDGSRDAAPLYIVHLACKEGVDAVAGAKAAGHKIFAETCPQYLEFTREVYQRPDAAQFVCSPAIKGAESRAALWSALQSGVIDTVATDHCPFKLSEKDAAPEFWKIPNGCGGVEYLYQYMLDAAAAGKISFSRAVELCAENPARLFGCEQKGRLQPGKDADIVLYNPEKPYTAKASLMHGASDHTIYEDREFRGSIEKTWLRGALVFDKGEYIGKDGGKFIKCGSCVC